MNLFDFILSLTISMYLGSKIFKGTVVLGKIIKLLNGKIGIFFGKLFINKFILNGRLYSTNK
tara:strand:+ start:1787 stop:1972 length:186 start_codon:yes stop_codon:yes gene_type:complete